MFSKLKITKSNRKILIIGGVILAVLAVLVIVPFIVAKSQKPAVLPQPTPVVPVIKNVSLRSFLGSTETEKCTSKEAVIYTDGGKVKGNFRPKVSGSVVPSSLIFDGDNIYIWVSGQKTGFQISGLAVEGGALLLTQTKIVDVNKKQEFSCVPWEANKNEFVLPQGVKFTDFSQIINSVPGTVSKVSDALNNPKVVKCAACDQLPGVLSKECRSKLAC